MNILYLLGNKGDGCAHYRMQMPAYHMRSLHATACKLPKDVTDDEWDNADMIIVQRHCEQDVYDAIANLKEQGKTIVFELDDDYWNLPHNLAEAKFYWNQDRLAGMEKLISLSHAVTVSTWPLAQQVKRFNPNVHIIPNHMDVVIDLSTKPQNDKVRIGFAGGTNHHIDFSSDIVQALLDVKREHDVELIFLGYIPERLIGQGMYYPFVAPSKYWSFLASLNFDIGIAPCIDNRWNRSKSDIKALEYASVGAVTVASDIFPYASSPQNLSLVDNTYKQWKDSLSMLIRMEGRRKEIAEDAWEYVKRERMIQDRVGEIAKVYEGIRGKV